MYTRSLVSLGAAGFIIVGFISACGGGSSSPSSPTPNPTPTAGTLTIRGASSASGAFSIRSLGPTAAPVMLPGTPSSVRIKAYKVYLAANADCTNPVLVQDKGGSDYVNVAGRPTLFSASVAPGTYNCMILKMSDVMKFTPDAAAQAASKGVCTAGQEKDFDILKSDESWYNAETNGSTAGAGGYATPVAQDVFLFFSTNGSATGGRVHFHQLVSLPGPVVIRSAEVTNGAFVFDFSGKMAVISESDVGPYYCWLEGVRTEYVGQ